MHITILHTNDIHGHLLPWMGWEGALKDKMVGGLATLGGAIQQVRREVGDQCLLLGAGDLIGDSILADLTKGKALITALNFLGYDALTIGNHEPDFGIVTLRKRIAEAIFPVVACNMFLECDSSLFTKPYIIKQVNSLRVGVVGIAYPKTGHTTAPKNVDGVRFEAAEKQVAKFIPRLREAGVDLVVVLSHLGLGPDIELASVVDGIDVIVGGHSHNRIELAKCVNGTFIVQAGAHGSDLGRIDLTVANGKVICNRQALILLDNATVAPHSDSQKLLDELVVPHREAMYEIIGTALDWLIRGQTLAGEEARKRDQESPVDSLFADLIRQQTNAELCFLPGVGYGIAIPPGPITAAQLRQLVPHDGKVVTMRLSGARIIEVLEQAVENVLSDDPAVKVGGMIQVSGLRFSYDDQRPKGHRIGSIERTEGTGMQAMTS